LATTRYSTSALERDDGLPLGGPGDEVGAQEHGIAGGGPTRVGAADPISVRVDHKFQRRGWAEEAVVEGAAEVAQDPLESGEMGLPWSVHMEAHLLDGVGDVGAGEGEEVLERACHAPVRCRIGDRGPIVLGELRLSVNTRGTGIAIEMSAHYRMSMAY
jgi:hypothetical protein